MFSHILLNKLIDIHTWWKHKNTHYLIYKCLLLKYIKRIVYIYNIHIIPSWIYKNGATTFIFQNDGWFVTNHERNIYYPTQETTVSKCWIHIEWIALAHNKTKCNGWKMANFNDLIFLTFVLIIGFCGIQKYLQQFLLWN